MNVPCFSSCMAAVSHTGSVVYVATNDFKETVKMTTYYPWKVWNLSAWLISETSGKASFSEKPSGLSLLGLSKQIDISQHILARWIYDSSEQITLEELSKIARYRKLSIHEVAAWLGICSGHLQEMIDQSKLANKSIQGYLNQDQETARTTEVNPIFLSARP